ncbi:uncharacterized protein LOC120930421 [Rana temporaria]|uniref:uncharacterized protein LOC120930421 n=1 Tax=Rana temporaria TaxID=8407 RepID=UPI001AAD08F8|nr:uncharacterized protein LOC120930421 [Rana temporaria]
MSTFGSYDRSTWPMAHSFVHASLGSYIVNPTATSSTINWLTKFHLSTYCKTLFASKQINRPLLEFESLYLLPEVPHYTLSEIYKLILAHIDNIPPTFTKLWSRELAFEVITGDWLKAFPFTHKSSISGYAQEKNNKQMFGWYRDPVTIHQIFPSAADTSFSEPSNLRETVRQSAMSEFSDSDQDAFDELDMLTPHTRSLQSLENAQSESRGDCSSDSDICKYTASLTIGFSDPEESLANLRLSLLDHTDHGNDNYNAENSTKWDDNLVILSHRKIKEFLAFSKKGPPSPPTPGLQIAADTTDTYSSKWENEQQHTSTISTSNEENQHKIREYLQDPSKAHTNPSHTMDNSVFSDSCSSNIIKGTFLS